VDPCTVMRAPILVRPENRGVHPPEPMMHIPPISLKFIDSPIPAKFIDSIDSTIDRWQADIQINSLM